MLTFSHITQLSLFLHCRSNSDGHLVSSDAQNLQAGFREHAIPGGGQVWLRCDRSTGENAERPEAGLGDCHVTIVKLGNLAF